MNLGLYLYLARRWALLAVIPAVVVAALAYTYASRQPKQYQTSITLYVQVPSGYNGGVSGSTDVYSSEAVIPTYSQILTAPFIGQSVDAQLASRWPGYHLADHGLTVAQQATTATQATQLMSATLKDSNPKRAAVAADAVGRVFVGFIRQSQEQRFKGDQATLKRQLDQATANIQDVSQRLAGYHGTSGGYNNLKAALTAYTSIYQSLLQAQQQFSVARDTARNSVKVLSAAEVPTSPIGPHPTQPAVLWGFVALVLSIGLILGYDYLDDTPRTPEEIEEIVGAPILGSIPRFDSSRSGGGLISAQSSVSPFTEAYRVIRTNLQFINIDHPPRILAVTSPGPNEGKSTTASNLAHLFAEAGKRVMLIDADLRRPSLHRIFSTERHTGLTNLLVGNDHLNGRGVSVTDHPNLGLIVSGPVPPRPAELLGTERMRDLLHHLLERSDLVILDSPPCLAVTDPAILSTVADGVILVVDPSKSKRRDLDRARETIEAVGGKILGVVINRLTRRGNGYYYYYHYGYGYQNRYDYTARDRVPAKA